MICNVILEILYEEIIGYFLRWHNMKPGESFGGGAGVCICLTLDFKVPINWVI